MKDDFSTHIIKNIYKIINYLEKSHFARLRAQNEISLEKKIEKIKK